MAGSRMRLVSRIAASTLFAALLIGNAAEAAPLHPDLTVLDMVFEDDGLNFEAGCASCLLSWTNPAGNVGVGSPDLGPVSFDWDGTSGAFSLNSLGTNGYVATLLGTVTSFASNGLGGYIGNINLTTTDLGFGDRARIIFAPGVGNTGFSASSANRGVLNADIVAVPEPSTLASVMTGLAAVGLFSRRGRRARL